jgi:hypothetical protein
LPTRTPEKITVDKIGANTAAIESECSCASGFVTKREQVVKVPRNGGNGLCHTLWHHLADICFWHVSMVADIDL